MRHEKECELKTIQVLGPGCPNCQKLVENAETAVRELGVDCDVKKISDIQEIMQFNVMLTPALAIDGVVKSSGKVLSVDELKEILSK